MKKNIVIVVLAILMGVSVWLNMKSPDTNQTSTTIDSLSRVNQTYLTRIDSLKVEARRIPDTIYRTRVIREQIPVEVGTMEPDELLQAWDRETGYQSQMQDSLALTPMPAIEKGLVALMQVPLMEQEIALHERLTNNQALQINYQDSVIVNQGEQISLYEQDNTVLREENTRVKKINKVLMWIAGVGWVMVVVF